MVLNTLWVVSFRDLLRNRRRTFFTLLAVTLGLALLIILNGLVAGVIEDSVQNNIRLNTGHIQIRATSYQEEKLSLLAKDLLRNPSELADRANALSEVKAAAPVLWASGILSTMDESANLKIFGVELSSPLYTPIREALVAGEFLTSEERDTVLLGKYLADSLGVGVGRKVNLAIINADGNPVEGNFTVRGLFSTGVPSYDESAVFTSLDKAQSFTRATGGASAVVILLHRPEDAGKVAAILRSPGEVTLTWRDLNKLLLQAAQTGFGVYMILDVIVMLVVAVIVANTLLMAVFERIREVGILVALGMKESQVSLMFLCEAAILGLVGILAGIALGSAGVAYLSVVGILIGNVGAATQGIALGTIMYARFVPSTIAWLSLGTLAIILLASLYPAWYAARLEPVEALRSV